MGPDRNNYEIWLIDYLDGALDKERTDLLFAFLDENPDIKEELGELNTVSLKPPSVRFRSRGILKRAPSDMDKRQFELLCVADMENDLGDDQKRELEELLSSDPDKRKTYHDFRKIKLTAPSTIFRYKHKLRKLTTADRIFRYSLTLVSTAAAVIILLIVLKGPYIVPRTENVAVNRITPPIISGSPSQENNIKNASPQSIQLVSNTNTENSVSKRDKKYIDAKVQPLSITSQADTLSKEITRNDIVKLAFSEVDLTRKDEEMRLADIKITRVSEGTDTEGNGPGQFLEKLFRDKVVKPEEREKGSLKAYDVADAGVKGLRKLFGWNISLQKNRNDKGEVRSVSFSSRLISFNAPVKKSSRLP